MTGPDCVIIPGALHVATPSLPGVSSLCGRSKGLPGNTVTTATKTVCSKKQT